MRKTPTTIAATFFANFSHPAAAARPAATKTRRPLLMLLAALACTAGGCGGNAPATVPVYGRALLDGHEWPKPGLLTFLPTESAPGFPKRPGAANFGVDGRFRAGSYSENDGLVPGTYEVRIACWEVPPVMGGRRPAKSCLPAAYGKPQWTLKVEPGSKPIEVEYRASTKGPS